AEANTGIVLTENFAMDPAASVCGYYFAGVGVKYFALGSTGQDQLEHYAKEKGVPPETLQSTLDWKIGTNDENEP
ncbi:MAG: hypothetical protein JXR21_05215, partial [Candidatus Marinimicrobia bacterium]|nr:hypothetical protein [Candidatus Neomarinimicrobiota bacterium]